MPVEFRPEIQQKPKKVWQQGSFQDEEFENLVMTPRSGSNSCRQRVLSVIKEEAEGVDE